jgi:xanthine dehydrogenase YagS FAD-binding subunit
VRPFAYARPSDPADAVELVASTPGAVFLAGGTNLVDLMKLGAVRPTMLVDVNGLGMAGVAHRVDGSVRIGAAVPNSDLAADEGIRRRHPLLAQALLAGASGQVRNMATVAGNLLQRTRCAYFQDVTKPCNKREPGSGCPARTGDHRNLSVLGGSDACIANHPSDMAVALAALDATLVVRTTSGERRLAIDELYRLPGDDPSRDTVLDGGSLIEAVEVPPPLAGAGSAYRKVRDRASFAFGLASVGAVLAVDDGTIRDIRLALGAIAPKPWRAHRAEAVLRGAVISAATLIEAVDAELSAATPLPGNAYKLTLVRRLVRGTLLELASR